MQMSQPYSPIIDRMKLLLITNYWSITNFYQLFYILIFINYWSITNFYWLPIIDRWNLPSRYETLMEELTNIFSHSDHKVEKATKAPTSMNGGGSTPNGVAEGEELGKGAGKNTHSQEVQTEEPPVKAFKT